MSDVVQVIETFENSMPAFVRGERVTKTALSAKMVYYDLDDFSDLFRFRAGDPVLSIGLVFET
jgi:hypothetical protein